MSISDLFKRNQGPGYRLHHHDPLKKRLKALAVVLLLVGSGYALYEAGYRKSGYDVEQTADAIQEFKERIAYLETQNLRLTQQVAQYERSREIEVQATEQVSGALTEMETEMLELREELAFYRSIVSPSKMEPGLKIQAFQLERGEAEGEFHYKLVLTQVRGNNRIARGSVEIRVSGTQGGEPKELTLAQMVSGTEELKFSFKYFQSVEGTLKLPAGFQPLKIDLKVDTTTRELEDIETSYEWNTTVVGERA